MMMLLMDLMPAAERLAPQNEKVLTATFTAMKLLGFPPEKMSRPLRVTYQERELIASVVAASHLPLAE